MNKEKKLQKLERILEEDIRLIHLSERYETSRRIHRIYHTQKKYQQLTGRYYQTRQAHNIMEHYDRFFGNKFGESGVA